MSLLLILAWVFPLLLAAGAGWRGLSWGPALGAIPALFTALVVPIGTELEAPWLLTGAVFGLDPLSRTFLLFTAILWLSAGVYASATMRGTAHRERFDVFFLLAMAGNLWLIVGQDLVSFYAGFALMGISSYGLVVHEGDRPALRAGRIYLILTLSAEVVLFMALVRIAAATDSLAPGPDDLIEIDDLTIGLLILGLAVKAGLVPLHVWLPLAHPAAPIPASAALSGAMIKVALLGWLRFLPIGELALPHWGLLFVFVGLATAFFAVPIGLVQSNPKTLLAYSSVSKMGLMVVVLGATLLEPEIAPLAVIGIGLYAGHHALTKGGLFLGIGLRKSSTAQRWVLTGIVLLALSMAAVPLTGGAVAKYGIKPALGTLEWTWLRVAIALTTMATAAMMARFLWIMASTAPSSTKAGALAAAGMAGAHAPGSTPRALAGPWGLIPLFAWSPLVILVLLYPLVFGTVTSWTTDVSLIAVAAALILPIVLVARYRPAILAPLRNSIAPGDILALVHPLILGYRWAIRWIQRRGGEAGHRALERVTHALRRSIALRTRETGIGLDERLTAWPLAGTLWLGIIAGLIAFALLWPSGTGPQRAAGAPPDETLNDAPGRAEIVAPAPLDGAPLALDAERGPVAPTATAPADAPDSDESPEPDVPDTVERGLTERTGTGSAAALEVGTDAPDQDQVSRPETSAPAAATVSSPTPPPASAQDAAAPMLSEGGSGAPPPSAQCDPETPYRFTDGAQEGLDLIRCRRVGESTEWVDAPPISNALLRLIQTRLNGLGFDAGSVDGFDGPATRGAIRQFQASIGMEVDGTIDFALLDQLQSSR
jgi:formate hydrogenlyase subunit 3/multisubunit Na+/H+ antiporter MnhD subunit